MCWRDEDELYNDGGAFKVTCRDQRGVMVTIIADNYFGYCKKEVKTQISYRGEPLRAVRGRARRRRHRVPGLRARARIFTRSRPASIKKQSFRGQHAPAGRSGGAAGRGLRGGPALPGHLSTCRRTRSSTCARALVRWPGEGGTHQLTLCGGRGLRAAFGLQGAAGEADGRNGLAADRYRGARHAVPQAVHGLRRRQIGDFEVDRRRPAEGAGVRQGLLPRHGAGGGDPQDGLLGHLPAAAAGQRARDGRS